MTIPAFDAIPAPLLRLGTSIFWNTLYAGRRYFIVLALFMGLFFLLRRYPARWKKLQAEPAPKGQVGRELRFSLLTIAISSCVIPLLFAAGLGPNMGYYRHIGEYGWPYFFLSIFLMMVVQDTYFYWTHRLMHHRALFRHFHRTHHLSTNPSPASTYAVHPLEAVVDSGASVVIIFIMPWNLLALLIFGWINVAYAIYAHLGYEIFPEGTNRHWLGRWINTSTAHNRHHASARYNYGWYFLFWDRLMGTLSPDADGVAVPAK
jgi:lathosterol oxidase